MNNANETLFAALEVSIKNLNQYTMGASYTVHKLDKTKLGLYYSGYAICLQKGPTASVYVLMMENTNERPAQQQSFENNRTTPGSAFDNVYKSKVHDHLLREFKQSIKELNETVVVGGMVPPDIFKVCMVGGMLVSNAFEATNPTAINELLMNATNAVALDIAIRVDQFKATSLQSVRNSFPRSSYRVSVAHNACVNEDHSLNDLMDAGGLPVRWDIKLTLSIVLPHSNTSASINSMPGEMELVSVYVAVDFTPLRHADSLDKKLPYKFEANFIITHFETESVVCTLEFMMLGLAMVQSYCKDNQWVKGIVDEKEGPQYMPSPINADLKNICALNVKYNPLKPEKQRYFKNKEITAMGVEKFVRTLVDPQMRISVDVSHASASSWKTEVFEHIDRHNHTEYIKLLGDFVGADYSKEWVPMLSDSRRHVDGGFVVMSDGRKIDIRHLADYLAIANTQTSERLFEHTDNVIEKVIYPNKPACMVQEAIYKHFNAQFTHSYTRLTFDLKFLELWSNIIQQAGIDVRTDAAKRATSVRPSM